MGALEFNHVKGVETRGVGSILSNHMRRLPEIDQRAELTSSTSDTIAVPVQDPPFQYRRNPGLAGTSCHPLDGPGSTSTS
jgi:hypothetical protein